ncbi:Protein of unknown function DUF1917 [Trinorchestia longiramus]|nr:Protein of unknown function DUF1917 [Trinorchestia longiramus]
MNPMSEFEEENIEVRDEALAEKFKCDPGLLGKWMLFYDKKDIDEMWEKAVSLYKAGELLGIMSIKTSTAAECPRSDRPEVGVIRFACGPCDDEVLILKYGFDLLKKMNYFTSYGFIAYRTDDQSRTVSMGIESVKSFQYRLPVPTHDLSKKMTSNSSEYPIEVPSLTYGYYLLQESLHSHVVEQITEPIEYGRTLRWKMAFKKGTQHDSAWVTACRLYRSGELDGVLFLCTTTAETKIKPYYTQIMEGIITFFSRPNELPSRLKKIGENLVRRLNYSHISGCLRCTRMNVDRPRGTELRANVVLVCNPCYEVHTLQSNMTASKSRILFFVAFLSVVVQLIAAQTFTYSKGWTNGKRRSEDTAVYKSGGSHDTSLETAAHSVHGNRWSSDQHRLLGRSASLKNLENRMVALESIFLNLMTSVTVPAKDGGLQTEKHATVPADYYAD